MKQPHHHLPEEPENAFPWEKGCYVLLLGIGLVMLAAWLHDIIEVMSGLMMGVFFLWQVIRGLIIKRYYWHIPEEKVSFWSLAVGLLLAVGFFLLYRHPGGGGEF